MLDDDDGTLQRNMKKIQKKIANTVLDHVAEVKHHASSTINNVGLNDGQDDEEVLSSSSSFPSEIECRMCLERGIFRRCCKSYYCHQCYYRAGHCPRCNKPTPLTGLAAAAWMEKEEPSKLAVGISWAISAIIVILTITALALLCWNVSTLPVTISGQHCRGWLPTCNLEVCIEHSGQYEDEESSGGLFLPATQLYADCNRSTSSYQVVASACVYDWEAYVWSNHSFGYDLCISSPREEQSSSSSDQLRLYTKENAGVYVFDDDFEYPLKEASAPWEEIINGRYSNACGINPHPSKRGSHGTFRPLENKNALVFGGKQRRHATTQGLNVEFGGTIEFHLKLGPLIQDDLSSSECLPAFEGDVTLEFKVNDEIWKTIDTYPAWKYRGEFHFISEDIPLEARSNSTQFRIQQPSFDERRDHWAVDDFRVMSRLKPQSAEYKELKRRQSEEVLLAQCCMDTNQCSRFDKRRISFDRDQCQNVISTRTNGRRRMKSSELLLVFTVLFTLSKLLYRLISSRFVRHAPPTLKERSEEVADSITMFPHKKFHMISSLYWQYTVAVLLCGMLLLSLYQLLHATMLFDCLKRDNSEDPSCRSDVSLYAFAALAFCIDARVIGSLLKRVFCIENPRKRKAVEVEVNLHPDKRHMRIGSDLFPLSEITALHAKSRLFSRFIAFCYVLAGLPLALGSLTIQSFDLGPRCEVLSLILGSLAVLREAFGPSFFAQFCLSVGWVFAYRSDDRNEFGRAVMRKGLLQQFLLGSCLTPAVVMFTLLIRRVEEISPTDNFILFLLFTVLGGLFGLILGIFRGLPTTPDVYFTAWPAECYAVTYYDKVKCPCLFSWKYCGEIHSRQVTIMIHLDDMHGFRKSLMGNLSSKNESS
jgi:hypothetical protein